MHFYLQELAVHVKKVYPKLFIAVEVYFALATHVEHHKTYLVFLLL